MTGERTELVDQTSSWASGCRENARKHGSARLRLEGTSPRATVKAVSEVIWGMLEQKEALISARKISR